MHAARFTACYWHSDGIYLFCRYLFAARKLYLELTESEASFEVFEGEKMRHLPFQLLFWLIAFVQDRIDLPSSFRLYAFIFMHSSSECLIELDSFRQNRCTPKKAHATPIFTTPESHDQRVGRMPGQKNNLFCEF